MPDCQKQLAAALETNRSEMIEYIMKIWDEIPESRSCIAKKIELQPVY